MRIQGASGGLATVLLIVSSSNTFAAGVHPDLPTVKTAQVSTAAAPATTATVTKTAAAATTPVTASNLQNAAVAKGPAQQAAVTTPVAQPKPVPVRPTLRATIDLSSQRMTIVSNGRKLHSWRISSGRTGYETPRGSFKPGWMAKRWHSRKYNMSPMPYSVFFNGGIATHGTTSVSRLGRPASHGCIRLHTANARRFYNLVRRHGMGRTRIVVTGHAKQSRVARRTRSSRLPRGRSSRINRNHRARYTARSYNRTPTYRPRAQAYRPRSRRLIYPGDRY